MLIHLLIFVIFAILTMFVPLTTRSLLPSQTSCYAHKSIYRQILRRTQQQKSYLGFECPTSSNSAIIPIALLALITLISLIAMTLITAIIPGYWRWCGMHAGRSGSTKAEDEWTSRSRSWFVFSLTSLHEFHFVLSILLYFLMESH